MFGLPELWAILVGTKYLQIGDEIVGAFTQWSFKKNDNSVITLSLPKPDLESEIHKNIGLSLILFFQDAGQFVGIRESEA